jgi:HK97 family phage major capsid protein
VGGVPVPVLRDDGTGGFTILTRPVIFTEKVPALGDKGDIMLADLSQYAVGLRAEILLEKSAHVGFKDDSTWYRAIVRADGQPTWDQPYTPAYGDTLSPFVVLEAR